MYHPPVGVWRKSPERMLLWAVEQVLHKVRQEPEKEPIAKWQRKIEKALNDPVRKYDWEAWYQRNVEGADLVKAVDKTPDGSDHWWDALAAKIEKELWKEAAQLRTKAEGLPFDPADLESGMQEAFAQVKGISETQKDQLRRMMKIAMQEREGQFGFADRIRQEWAAYSKAKAEQIAVTEWNRAASHATWRELLKSGVNKKVWFTAGDDRVCDFCESNAAMGEIGIAQEFFSGDLYPPAHPGCRCNISGAGG